MITKQMLSCAKLDLKMILWFYLHLPQNLGEKDSEKKENLFPNFLPLAWGGKIDLNWDIWPFWSLLKEVFCLLYTDLREESVAVTGGESYSATEILYTLGKISWVETTDHLRPLGNIN